MNKIKKIYDVLLDKYGCQGWWPLLNHSGCNPTKTGCVNGYHVKDYSFPHNDFERFEICIGAILTQNTSWPSVEKSLINLNEIGLIDAKKIIDSDDSLIKEAIKPSGYFNQKCTYLKNFSEFYLSLKGIPKREELLAIKGIGNETADSILLYAFGVCSFVVDTYTKRIFLHLGLINDTMSYDNIKELFESNLEPNLITYQEYHALIVEHAKQHYSKKPYCDNVLG